MSAPRLRRPRNSRKRRARVARDGRRAASIHVSQSPLGGVLQHLVYLEEEGSGRGNSTWPQTQIAEVTYVRTDGRLAPAQQLGECLCAVSRGGGEFSPAQSAKDRNRTRRGSARKARLVQGETTKEACHAGTQIYKAMPITLSAVLALTKK